MNFEIIILPCDNPHTPFQGYVRNAETKEKIAQWVQGKDESVVYNKLYAEIIETYANEHSLGFWCIQTVKV